MKGDKALLAATIPKKPIIINITKTGISQNFFFCQKKENISFMLKTKVYKLL
jgi:hypothetical protein